MKKHKQQKTMPVAHVAVLTLAEIKAAAAAFDRGETNVRDALAAIAAAVESYRETEPVRREAA